MKETQHKITRHYKKIAAAIGGAVVLAASAIHGLGTTVAPHETATPTTPAVTHEGQQLQTDQQPLKTASQEEASAEKVLDITATAYAPGPHDNDQWGDKTHMGTTVRPGVIAVDPRVIPLGSRVMIKYPDGSKEYAVAEDTGGAIKGHRIDIAKWTVKEAYRFGIKPVKVYVLSTPGPKNQDQA